MASRFFDFVLPACHGQTFSILDCVLGKNNLQGKAQAVCRLAVRAFPKQYHNHLLLPVGPLVGRLEQEVKRAHKQALECIPNCDCGTGYTQCRIVGLTPFRR